MSGHRFGRGFPMPKMYRKPPLTAPLVVISAGDIVVPPGLEQLPPIGPPPIRALLMGHDVKIDSATLEVNVANGTSDDEFFMFL